MVAPVPRGTFKRPCRKCGWSNTYTTTARANFGKRKHSCERQLAIQASHDRGAARKAAIDRTPKPCLHKVAEHTHGTYACYVLDRCKCPPCAKANSDYENDRNRQRAYGRWDNLIDAEPARRHVRELMAAGMGLKRIAEVTTGTRNNTGQIWKLVYGRRKPDGTQVPTKRIRKDVAERLLAVEVDLAEGAYIPAHGAVLRIRALVALGWSQARLADRLGIAGSNFVLATGTHQTRVTTARAVAALYAELSMTPPPETHWREKISASRSRNYAADHGWVPPLALDDDRLDDPTYEPETWYPSPQADSDGLDEAAIWRRMHGDKTVPLSQAETDELVRRWAKSGRSQKECLVITGIRTDRHLEKAS